MFNPVLIFLKPPREDAFLDSAGRLFHNLAPRKEKHFCPLILFVHGLAIDLSMDRSGIDIYIFLYIVCWWLCNINFSAASPQIHIKAVV